MPERVVYFDFRPMNQPATYIIDFETFYDSKGKYTLRHYSYPEFVMDARFKVFGMSVDDGVNPAYWVPADDIPAWLEEHSGDIIIAHNTFFDGAVLTWHYKFRPAYMLCTLQIANHVLGSSRDVGKGSNSLRDLAETLGLEPKGKLEFMDGVSDPDEAQLAMLATYAKQDAKLARQVLEILLPQVTNQDFELWLLDHTIRIYTERSLEIDTAKLAIARKKIEERRKQAIIDSGVTSAVLNSNKQFAEELATRLKAAKIKLPMKKPAKPRKDGVDSIPALAKGDVAFQKLAESKDLAVSALVQARIIERSAVTVAARLATMQRYADLGIGIPVHLVYYGAHTGRFAGGGGFNFQNLTSPTRAATAFDREVAALVRECIIAGKGQVFVPTDAAQIEARVLAWLAGEQSILDDFATGADIYSKFISEVLGKDVHKPTEAEKANKELVQWLGIMRQVGKESVLGLGYSMGADKFFDNLKNGGSVKSKDLVKFMEAGGITAKQASEIVEFYREKYDKIVTFWDNLDKAFKAAITGAVRKVGKLTFKRIGPKAVGITLPSGRTLYYRHLRQEAEKTKGGQYRKVWKHGNGQRIYGGLLAENVTQAVARDILVESIHDAESAGYPVVLHIHDEVVPRVPEGQGEAVLTFMIDSLSTPPSWGAGLVLGAEGHVTQNLSK